MKPVGISKTSSRLRSLIELLRALESAVAAYSGGVDSTFLVKALRLSGIKALAVTSVSESVPPWDLEDAKRLAKEIGIEHRLIHTRELQNEDYARNSGRRCFHCKDELFGELKKIALAEEYRYVLDGSTADDTSDYRPGMEAARKHGVRSPLLEAGFTKDEIRGLSKELGLPTWDKPSSPCLSSRLPYGTRVTAGALTKIARAEEALRALGLREFRVRCHGDVARIEARAAELGKILQRKDTINEALRRAGFLFACLDLQEFKSGNLNRFLDDGEKDA